MGSFLAETRVPVAAFDWFLRRVPSLATVAERWPGALFAMQVVTLLATSVALNTVFQRVANLPHASYYEPVLALEMVVRLGPLLLATALAGVFGLWRFGALGSPWRAVQHGTALRNATIVLVAVLAWPVLTQGYNHYFDQPYLADRLLLLSLVVLVWYRPAFLLAFLPVFYLLLGQTIEPEVGGSVLPHKLQVSHALGIVAAGTLLHGATGQRNTLPLLLVLVCFVAAQYWLPALAKLRLDWLATNELHLMPLAAYAHGWLGVLSPEQVVGIAQALAPLDVVMRWSVIIVEGACLVMLWKRWLTVGLLTAVIAFHIGVLMICGLFFWTWIALDLVLLILLLRRSRWPRLHTPLSFGISLVLILASPLWSGAPSLGWYETPLVYTYRVDAVFDDGHRETLHPGFFAPYEEVFGFAAFSFANPARNVMLGSHGVTRDAALRAALSERLTAAEVFALEGPAQRYDASRAEALYTLIRDYLVNRNRNGDRLAWLHRLHPPSQVSDMRSLRRQLGGAHIREAALVEETWYFDGESLSRIREEALRVFDIAGSQQSAPGS
jgi:hypothetical protein